MLTRTNLNEERVTGRLGNQLWVIASIIGIADKLGVPFVFPDWNKQRWFKNQLPTDNKLWSAKLRIYNEPSYYYNEVNLDTNYDWNMYGYFQSYKYFENSIDKIKHYFHQEYYGWGGVEYNTCAVHVRRGDYVQFQDVHPLAEVGYYMAAMKLLPADTQFTFFSDDPKWVNENFKGNNIYILDGNHEPVLDFFDMTNRYRHIITANSSYSWWAAYLKPFDDKVVISPALWVRGEGKDDRVPKEWIRL